MLGTAPILSAADLAADSRLGVTAVVGPTDAIVGRAVALDIAGPNCLSFARDVAWLTKEAERLHGAVIFAPAPAPVDVVPVGLTLLITANPRLSFMRAVGIYFGPPVPPEGVHATAIIDPSAQIHPSASIGAYCCIGADCSVGAGSVLYPHVILYNRVSMGARCRVNSGTVIGADGFGYERNEHGELEKFPHLGGVLIGDDVEIGSNTSIDRGSLGNTVIGDRARIDNLVHVAHNVQIGEDAAVIALTMLGGSSKIGTQAWVAPGAVLMNQVKIGANGTVGLGAVVVKDVDDGQTVMGAPAQDSAEFKATRAAIARLTKG